MILAVSPNKQTFTSGTGMAKKAVQMPETAKILLKEEQSLAKYARKLSELKAEWDRRIAGKSASIPFAKPEFAEQLKAEIAVLKQDAAKTEKELNNTFNSIARIRAELTKFGI